MKRFRTFMLIFSLVAVAYCLTGCSSNDGIASDVAEDSTLHPELKAEMLDACEALSPLVEQGKQMLYCYDFTDSEILNLPHATISNYMIQ